MVYHIGWEKIKKGEKIKCDCCKKGLRKEYVWVGSIPFCEKCFRKYIKPYPGQEFSV